MTDAPPPPQHRRDALDDLEASALAALSAGPGGSWEQLRSALAQAEGRGDLTGGPPPIDPSESRRSTRELRVLVEALEGGAHHLPEQTRAGYSIKPPAGAVGPADRSAVEPAFAAALGGTVALRVAFHDLWAIDAPLWENLGSSDARGLAYLWLESPGRRLVQDVGALAAMPREEPLGASDLSLDRIYAAAGVSDAPAGGAELVAWLSRLPPHFQRWRERSAAIPGQPQGAWAPYDGRVARAFRQLEQASSIGIRGAALRWLLERAAREPFYEVDGLRRDLREDLPVRLASALDAWLGADPAAAIASELEALALQHAARITAGDDRPGVTLRAWGVARWLHSCLSRSPFFGGDDKEVLAANLRAVLHQAPTQPRDGADALDPARFSAAGDGLDPAEIAFLGGVIGHYRRGWGSGQVLLPTPLPLVRALRRLAGRKVRSGEESAEEALAAGRDALGWGAPHVAPPLAARWIMTDLRIAWLEHLDEGAQLDALARLDRDPARFDWTAWAVHREGPALGPAARARALGAVRRFLGDGALPGEMVGAMAAGLLSDLSDDEAISAAERASTAAAAWRPFVLDALAAAAELSIRIPVWEGAMERLLGVMMDVDLDDKVRLNAALFALRRTSGSRLAGRAEMLGRVAQAALGPPFSEHGGLRRELRRLGLSGPVAAGGKR